MGIYLSPGVYSKETDLSDIVTSIATTTAGIVGYSAKGDTTQLRLITNKQQFIQEYGEPNPSTGYFHYSALAYLENGSTLYCMRVVNGALYGGVAIKTDASSQSNAAISTGASTPDFIEVSGEDDLFNIFGKDPGVWNNNLGVRITNIDNTEYTFNIEVYYTDSDGISTNVETWTVSRESKVDGYGRQLYLEDRINGFSDYIVVADNTTEADTVMPKAQATTLAFSQGSDGSAVTNANVITGWGMFANPDDVDVRLLINAGYTDVTVQQEMKTIAEDRKDCFAILDMPSDQLTSVAAMVTWRNSTQNFNSSYCGLYTAWVKIYDVYNDKMVAVPPSGYVASQMAYSDYNAEVWYAPAGFKRGLVNVLSVTDGVDRLVFTKGERDTLQQVQINPIQVFSGDGIAIWGEYTEQSKASALSLINVRRSLIVLEKSIAASLRFFTFDPNNENTRLSITAMCETYLDNLSAKGAFQLEAGDKGYKVVCDTTNNTPATIDMNELHVDIFVKPVRSSLFIQLNTIITTSGASFNELIARGVNL